MNRDHEVFIAQRDKLLGLLYSYAPVDMVDSTLDELFEHTRQHFAEEDRQMIERRFPPYQAHTTEHERALGDMAAHIAHWKQNRETEVLIVWLRDALAEWLIDHINKMDFVSAWFIADQ